MGNVPSVPSLALGSGEVTLQSLTAAYAAFANRGQVPTPLMIRRVEDRDGRVLHQTEPSVTRAVSETTAFLMSNMMADVINAGTGARARQLGFKLPAAGKTGTTNEYRDAWFIGFTPSLVTGVWVGYDQPRTIMPGGFASDVAVPMWANFMKVATRNDKPQWYATPARITTASVCRMTGKLATGACNDVEVVEEDGRLSHRSMVYREYFVEGTEPTDECSLHRSRGVLGTLASVFGGGREAPPPPKVQDTNLPSVSIIATGIPNAPAPAEPVVKKRGFWSRVFGVGRDRNSGKSEDKKIEKK